MKETLKIVAAQKRKVSRRRSVHRRVWLRVFVDILRRIGDTPGAIGFAFNTETTIMATGLQNKLALLELQKRGLIEVVEVETPKKSVNRLTSIHLPWLRAAQGTRGP